MIGDLLGPFFGLGGLGYAVSAEEVVRAQQNVPDRWIALRWGETARQAEEYRRWRTRADDADELREARNYVADAPSAFCCGSGKGTQCLG